MSLRHQIQAAVDDVTPQSPDLERRVRAYVIAGSRERDLLRSRPRRSTWRYRFQGAPGLVAVLLVIALMAGVVIGGRFWRDLNSTPSNINQTELKRLESRSFSLPVVAPGAACPVTPVALNPNIGMVVGAGPVYLGNRDIYESNDWGMWVAAAFVSAGKTPGLVLIRAKDLQSGGQVAFAQYPLSPSGITAVGKVLGSTRVADHLVQLRSEAVFSDPWLEAQPAELVVLFGMEKGSSGCIAFQVDGPGFQENFVNKPAEPSF